MAEKKYGHFDDANREYVITDPKTPEVYKRQDYDVFTAMTQFLNNSVPQFFSDPSLLSLFRSLLYIYNIYNLSLIHISDG